jgi:hypothetical protein
MKSSLRRLALVALSALCGAPALGAQPPSPAPHCLNAREVREAHQSDAHTLALRLNDESRYRLELADACPAALVRDRPTLVSREGWVCGSNEEYVDLGDRRCAVAGLAKIDAREYADHALRGRRYASSLDASGKSALDKNTLETIEVRSRQQRRTFGGTTAYCLDARHMRGWREDGDDIVVEVSPLRSGGNRYYRVELAGQCSEMITMQTLRLESPTGGSAICGTPGDRAFFSRNEALSFGSAAILRPLSEGGLAAGFGCAISRVYPLLPDEVLSAAAGSAER